MTTYAEVQGTTLIQYPYGFAQLQAENEFTNYGGNYDFVSIFPNTDHVRAWTKQHELIAFWLGVLVGVLSMHFWGVAA